MVVELQHEDGHHHRQAHNHHGTCEVLSWKKVHRDKEQFIRCVKILSLFSESYLWALNEMLIMQHTVKGEAWWLCRKMLQSQWTGWLVSGGSTPVNKPKVRTPQGPVRGWLTFFTEQAKHIQSWQSLMLQQPYPVNTHETYTPLKERCHFLSWSSCDVSELSKRKPKYNWSSVKTCQSERWGAFHFVYQFCSSCSVLICVLQ